MSVTLRTVLSFASLAALGLVAGGALFVAGAVFAAPLWLHLGWLAPGLLLLDAVAARRRLRARARIGEPAAVERLVEGRGPGLRAVRALLAAGGILLLAIACARPQWGVGEEQLKRQGVDVLICVDVSKSMLAEDQKPNRLARARLTVDSLLERMQGNRVGLVAYAGEARVLCPLTLDHAAAGLFLDTLDPAVLQRPGTAIGTALRLAGRLLKNDEGRNGAVILLTDGEDHGGDAVEAAGELARAGIVVHAVGYGSTEGTPIPLREEQAGRSRRIGFVKDREGNAVMTRLDVAQLEEIVEAGGGRFVRAARGEVALAALAQDVARMDQQEFASRKTRTRPDRYAWFLVPALLLLAAEAVLPDGGRLRRRREPTTRLAAAQWAGRRKRGSAA